VGRRPKAEGVRTPDSATRATMNRMVRLQANQDRSSQAWTKFLILIQSGLGTAYGYMAVSVFKVGGGPDYIRAVLALAVGVVGFVTCHLLKDIIIRAHQWSTWFIRKYNELDGRTETMFPLSDSERRGEPVAPVRELPSGWIAERIVTFCDWAMVLWVCAILFSGVVAVWAGMRS